MVLASAGEHLVLSPGLLPWFLFGLAEKAVIRHRPLPWLAGTPHKESLSATDKAGRHLNRYAECWSMQPGGCRG